MKEQVSRHFGVDRLLSTSPRFVSRMDEKPAHTMHDEYWHEHVDASQYPGFEYTALVYLNRQGVKPVRPPRARAPPPPRTLTWGTGGAAGRWGLHGRRVLVRGPSS